MAGKPDVFNLSKGQNKKTHRVTKNSDRKINWTPAQWEQREYRKKKLNNMDVK